MLINEDTRGSRWKFYVLYLQLFCKSKNNPKNTEFVFIMKQKAWDYHKVESNSEFVVHKYMTEPKPYPLFGNISPNEVSKISTKEG